MLVIRTTVDEYCLRVVMSTLKLSAAKREKKKKKTEIHCFFLIHIIKQNLNPVGGR
jgi:hypothetical protein